jgi:hypothetical protein
MFDWVYETPVFDHIVVCKDFILTSLRSFDTKARCLLVCFEINYRDKSTFSSIDRGYFPHNMAIIHVKTGLC